MTLWLRFMYNKPMAEISLTLAGAYGTYIVGEQLFGVSPVLAVVFLGTPFPPQTSELPYIEPHLWCSSRRPIEFE